MAAKHIKNAGSPRIILIIVCAVAAALFLGGVITALTLERDKVFNPVEIGFEREVIPVSSGRPLPPITGRDASGKTQALPASAFWFESDYVYVSGTSFRLKNGAPAEFSCELTATYKENPEIICTATLERVVLPVESIRVYTRGDKTTLLPGASLPIFVDVQPYDANYRTAYLRLPEKIEGITFDDKVGRIYVDESVPVGTEFTVRVNTLPKPDLQEELVDEMTLTVAARKEIRTDLDFYNMRYNNTLDYVLLNDIDLSRFKNYRPFSYYGDFDGGGCLITGIDVYLPAVEISVERRYGLFENLYAGAAVRNISVRAEFNADPEHNSAANVLVGFIAATNSGIIENCKAYGKIILSRLRGESGGIVAFNNSGGVISRCASFVESYHNAYGGGIAGSNYGTISESYNAGEVHLYYVKNAGVGGICWYNYGKITDCYNIGAIYNDVPENSGYNRPVLGGLVGYNASDGTITNCFSTGRVYAEQLRQIAYYSRTYNQAAWSGALIGYNIGTKIESAFWLTNTWYREDAELKAIGSNRVKEPLRLFRRTEETIGNASISLGDKWEYKPSEYPFPQLKNNPHTEPQNA